MSRLLMLLTGKFIYNNSQLNFKSILRFPDKNLSVDFFLFRCYITDYIYELLRFVFTHSVQ